MQWERVEAWFIGVYKKEISKQKECEQWEFLKHINIYKFIISNDETLPMKQTLWNEAKK